MLLTVLWVSVERRFPALGIGAVVICALLAAVTGLAAPATSYLFSWAAIAGGLLLIVDSEPGPISVVRGALVGVSLLLTVPAIDVFFQMSQPRPGNPDSNLLPVMAVVALLAALVVGLLSVGQPTPDD